MAWPDGPINHRKTKRNGWANQIASNQVMEGMAADGMDSSFMSIFGEFLEGYSKCAIRAGTTPEQFQFSIGTLIKVSQKQQQAWWGDHGGPGTTGHWCYLCYIHVILTA